MDIARRLERIEQEIRQVEDEKTGANAGCVLGTSACSRSHYHTGSYDISPEQFTLEGRGRCSKKSKRSLFGRDRENDYSFPCNLLGMVVFFFLLAMLSEDWQSPSLRSPSLVNLGTIG